MGLSSLLEQLGPPIEDAYEETFLLFSQDRPDSQSLGFVDARATSITVDLGENVEVEVTQSPTLLHSSLSTGTTGAVLWRISPLVAGWMATPTNIFFEAGVLSDQSTVLELGCGISGVVALAAAPRVGAYVCTDQHYVLKQLRDNIANNAGVVSRRSARGSRKAKRGQGHATKQPPAAGVNALEPPCNIQVLEVDWETSSLESLPMVLGAGIDNLDMVIACDCVYNSHLIEPLTRVCADACRSRPSEPVVCLVAQQLRSEEVFQEWLSAFMGAFQVWRLPDSLLCPTLRSREGYVLHVGILKGSTEQGA